MLWSWHSSRSDLNNCRMRRMLEEIITNPVADITPLLPADVQVLGASKQAHRWCSGPIRGGHCHGQVQGIPEDLAACHPEEGPNPRDFLRGVGKTGQPYRML